MDASTLSTTTTAVATENALSTTVDGETVILHTGVGKYYGLNEVGTFVWESLQEPRTIEELCREVTGEYHVAGDRCRNDIMELLVDLEEKGLVQFVEK